jgi:glutamyl-tRNA reductase
MFCISVSFKKTPLEIRQQFAFSKEEHIAFLSYLINKQIITGGIIVSTCNRSEMYFTGNVSEFEMIENELSDYKHISKENIKKYSLYYQGKKAVRHLYKVSCGLDSMVLGEDEVLRQVKEAYLLAEEKGFTNSELNIIFQGAFNCAKLSKSETRLSNTPVSIGTLTANAIEEYLKSTVEKSTYQTSIHHQKVLLIGATGKIGSIVTKNLIAKGIYVIGTRRSVNRGEELFLQDNDNMEWIEFDKRYEMVSKVEVIVSATSSPHYTLTKEEFLRHRGQKNYLLIDLAVPYDLDKELGIVQGIALLDIDYFKTLSEENSNIKFGEMEKVEHILDECVEEVLKKLYMRDFQEKMNDKYEEKWFQKMLFYLRDVLDSEQLQEVLDKIYHQEMR